MAEFTSLFIGLDVDLISVVQAVSQILMYNKALQTCALYSYPSSVLFSHASLSA